MDTLTPKSFADLMHSQAVNENIYLRELLADKSVAHDGADLVELALMISDSDKKVKTWQDRLMRA